MDCIIKANVLTSIFYSPEKAGKCSSKKYPFAEHNNVILQRIAFCVITTIKFSNTTQCGEFTQCIISYSKP
jgi:hypothetical protein